MTLKINVDGINREMTEEEETAYLAFTKKLEADNKIEAEAQAAKLAARQNAIDKLGLTADEAAALFG
jgi:hypothetical protein